jgi:hypothetical protein
MIVLVKFWLDCRKLARIKWIGRLIVSRDPRYIESKQTGALPGKDPCRGRDYALKYFVNSIYSPSVRAASDRFSAGVVFSTFLGCHFERPSFFLAYASQHLPMLRLRGRFKPFDAEPCARLNRWRPPTAGLIGPADLILPSSLPSFTLNRRRFHHVRASCLLLRPSLEVLLCLSHT